MDRAVPDHRAMRRLPFVLSAALVATTALPSIAHAAACCGEVSAFGDRLNRDEALATSVGISAGPRFGSFDRDGTHHGIADGASDLAFGLDLDAVVRLTEALELGASAGGIVNARSSEDASAVGGGVGDVHARARAVLVDGTETRWWPGLSALVSVVVPTGIPASRSTEPFAVDVTGQGAGELGLGVSADKLFEDVVFVRLDGSVGFFLPEAVDGQRVLRSPRLVASLTVGPSFAWGSLSAGVSHEAEGAPISPSSRRDAASARQRTELSLGTTVVLGRDVSLLAGVRTTLPIDGFGAEDDARLTAHAALRFAYYDPRMP
jgi:hypothetical protein